MYVGLRNTIVCDLKQAGGNGAAEKMKLEKSKRCMSDNHKGGWQHGKLHQHRDNASNGLGKQSFRRCIQETLLPNVTVRPTLCIERKAEGILTRCK